MIVATRCGHYECDGLHYQVGICHSTRTGELLATYDPATPQDEQQWLDSEEAGERRTVALVRCPECNPEPERREQPRPETVAPATEDEKQPAEVFRWWTE
mgnify:CR=1 FL=1